MQTPTHQITEPAGEPCKADPALHVLLNGFFAALTGLAAFAQELDADLPPEMDGLVPWLQANLGRMSDAPIDAAIRTAMDWIDATPPHQTPHPHPEQLGSDEPKG